MDSSYQSSFREKCVGTLTNVRADRTIFLFSALKSSFKFRQQLDGFQHSTKRVTYSTGISVIALPSLLNYDNLRFTLLYVLLSSFYPIWIPKNFILVIELTEETCYDVNDKNTAGYNWLEKALRKPMKCFLLTLKNKIIKLNLKDAINWVGVHG